MGGVGMGGSKALRLEQVVVDNLSEKETLMVKHL